MLLASCRYSTVEMYIPGFGDVKEDKSRQHSSACYSPLLIHGTDKS